METFPINKTKNSNIHIKPLSNTKKLFSLSFSKYTFITATEMLENDKIFTYELTYPERGIVIISKINGCWETILVDDCRGNDLSHSTYNAIEDWLWDNIPTGNYYQSKFDFNGESKLKLREKA